jgi:signal recognition particle subunit SRP54
MEHMQDLAQANPDKQKEMVKKLEEGKLSIRDWREQMQNVMNMYANSSAMILQALIFVIPGVPSARLPR